MYFLIPAILAIPATVFCYSQNNHLTYTKHKITLNIKNKIRIVQISDLHSKEFGKNNNILIDKILKVEPDIIFATGDLIDSSLKNLDNIITFLSKLNATVPVVYIPGNNEVRSERLTEIIIKLKKEKVITLNNQIVDLTVNSTNVHILGLVEILQCTNNHLISRATSTYTYSGAPNLFKELEKRKGLKIVLSHYPENYEFNSDNSYFKYNFDLMFSGHAHGGQFILPGLGGLFAPGQGILPKYYSGIYSESNKNKLIVSRGLGNSGFPLRLFNKPDIVIVDIY